MQARVPFVDAHVHLWQLDRLHYGWLSPPFSDEGPNGSVAAIAHDYGVADYRAEAGKWDVRGCVHVDAGADAAQALDETDWLESVAAETGLPTGLVAFAALHASDVEPLLAAQAARPRVRGIRHIVNWHPDPARSYTPADLTQDDRWRAGFALLGKYGLSFDLQCYPAQMPGLVSLLERHPEIPVMINHLGMPVVSDPDGVAQWRHGLALLAALPHVAIKLSGLGFIYRDWTAERVTPFLEAAVALFGTQRAMFASDTPTDTLFAPFDRTLETYHAFAERFSEDERRDLFGRNANRLYRLGLSF